MTKNDNYKTTVVRGSGQKWPVSEVTYCVAPPLYQSATFGIRHPQDAAQIIARGGETYFKGEDYIYTRGGNPTQRELEKTLAKLEGAEAAITFASGMAAISALAMSLLQKGDHVVITKMVFGDTYYLFNDIFNKFGVSASFIDTSNLDEVKNAVNKKTKLLFIETPANPKLIVTDLKKVSQIAHNINPEIIVAVDNTFSTSYIQRPLELGCDCTVISTTKFVNGHTDAVGGAIMGSKDLLAKLRLMIFATGGIMDPFAAWLTLRGIQTLPIRIDRQCQTAQKIFDYLKQQKQVLEVFYPGDQKGQYYDLAKKQMSQFGSMIAFRLKTDLHGCQDFINQLKLFTFAVSLGSTKSLISHPASMTHAIMTTQQREQAGIEDNLLRISIGLEDYEDLKADLDQAFNNSNSN